MRVSLTCLSEHPDFYHQVRQSYVRQWGSLESEHRLFDRQLQRHKVLLALHNGNLVASVQIRREWWGTRYWLANLLVLPAYRQQGIASQLVKHAQRNQRLYARTEHLDGGLYAKLGWQVINTNSSWVVMRSR
ncbi:GNAT family N-acetyltransferase [Salinibius halmophilus]|uniref:GNAT family N-acetyltransferase n=1 Tax=Salinibius halmophilus TaxID=1853216 RepID=UPI000E672520|nr:GNAT family N-acetyltransferase [Salinibius halmophilus]